MRTSRARKAGRKLNAIGSNRKGSLVCTGSFHGPCVSVQKPEIAYIPTHIKPNNHHFLANHWRGGISRKAFTANKKIATEPTALAHKKPTSIAAIRKSATLVFENILEYRKLLLSTKDFYTGYNEAGTINITPPKLAKRTTKNKRGRGIRRQTISLLNKK